MPCMPHIFPIEQGGIEGVEGVEAGADAADPESLAGVDFAVEKREENIGKTEQTGKNCWKICGSSMMFLYFFSPNPWIIEEMVSWLEMQQSLCHVSRVEDVSIKIVDGVVVNCRA